LPAANGSAYARLSGPAAGQLWLVERVFSATGLTTFGYRLDFYGTEVDVNSVGGVAHQQEQIAMRAIDPNAIALDLSEVEFSPPLYVAGGNPFTIQWTGAPGHTFNDGQQVRAHVQYRVCALV
jgi:hypothetical protein